MSKKWATAALIVILLVIAGYVIYDAASKKDKPLSGSPAAVTTLPEDRWSIVKAFDAGKGQLNSVAVGPEGDIILGGASFVACYHNDFSLAWEYQAGDTVTAVACSGENVYAAAGDVIEVLDRQGTKTDEWGPYDSNMLITSLAASESYVAFADAQGKSVYILDKQGVMKSILGRGDEPFVIPSGFFDVALDSSNTVYVANTGKKRIEKRSIDDKILGYFGESGNDPDSFCGCCNPAHFALIPGGYLTAEKGINRIKILNREGSFVEFVSSSNNFPVSVPLDVASDGGKVIYAANPADSKLYVFKRKS